MTNAMRAILDVWIEGSLPKPVLREAFREAMKRGNITKTSGRDVSAGCGTRLRAD